MKQNTSNTEVPVFFTVYSETTFITLIEDTVKKVMTQFNQSESTTYNPDELLTVEQVCEEYDVCSSTLATYKKDAKLLPCLRKEGTRRVYYRRSDLQKFFGSSIFDKPTRRGRNA